MHKFFTEFKIPHKNKDKNLIKIGRVQNNIFKQENRSKMPEVKEIKIPLNRTTTSESRQLPNIPVVQKE